MKKLIKRMTVIIIIATICLALVSCQRGQKIQESFHNDAMFNETEMVETNQLEDTSIIASFSTPLINLGEIDAKFASDIPYDIFNETKFDVFLPNSEDATGLVIYIHGGGFKTGDKSKLYSSTGNQKLIKELLSENIAVASINYRLVTEDDEDGILKCINDSKRALQFIRYNNDELNIE